MTHPLHRLDLAEPGTFTGARIVCLGTDDDLCRRWCAEDCEDGCYATPLPADVELVAQAPVDGHRFLPVGYCREATWINSAGIADAHLDDEGFPWDEDGAFQLGIRSGWIEVEWTDDDYVWSYAENAPPVDQPVHRDQLPLGVG